MLKYADVYGADGGDAALGMLTYAVVCLRMVMYVGAGDGGGLALSCCLSGSLLSLRLGTHFAQFSCCTSTKVQILPLGRRYVSLGVSCDCA